MTSPILYAGQEDISFTPAGANFVSTTPPTVYGSFGPDTTANTFRSGYARYAFSYISSVGYSGTPVDTIHYARTAPAFTATSFWVSMRINTYCANGSGVSGGIAGITPIRLADSSGIVRLVLVLTGTTQSPNDNFNIKTVNAAGTQTIIGSASTGKFMSFQAATTTPAVVPDKIDIFVNYAVSGQIIVYCNGVQTFTYSGDITTNSVTSLSYVDIGQTAFNNVFGTTCRSGYSEIIVSTSDTRNLSLVTQAPSAAGNTDTFTSGLFSNINQNLANYTSPDNSATASQIQEYKVGQAIPTGSFSVISVVQHAMCTVGSTGPQHIQFMVRTGSTDYNSASLAPGVAWGVLQNNWDTNPNTSAAWATTDLVASSVNFNIGYESIT